MNAIVLLSGLPHWLRGSPTRSGRHAVCQKKLGTIDMVFLRAFHDRVEPLEELIFILPIQLHVAGHEPARGKARKRNF